MYPQSHMICKVPVVHIWCPHRLFTSCAQIQLFTSGTSLLFEIILNRNAPITAVENQPITALHRALYGDQ